MSTNLKTISDLAQREYKWGFVTELEEDRVPKGLNEETIRIISAKKNETEFMLEWRLRAYRHWASLEKSQAEPKWANIKYPPIDYQAISYYSAPKRKPGLKSLDEVDPEILSTYEKQRAEKSGVIYLKCSLAGLLAVLAAAILTVIVVVVGLSIASRSSDGSPRRWRCW